MKAADLTVIANFHREGALAYTALSGAFLAVDAAARHGVRCRVLAILDRPDEATRAEVARFGGRLVGALEIDAGDIAAARNRGLERVETPMAAFLDGDDLFDRDWLWKGFRFLDETGGGEAVAHARVRLTFGSERDGRIQISSESPFFHPLNLIASWHWASDTIGPVGVFRRIPFVPNDHVAGFGGEDWLWSCESLAAGVRHLVVPETVYFYRRQARHGSLGSVPGITFRRTRLFDDDVLERWVQTSPSASLGFADRLEGSTGPAERWGKPPGWLRAAVRRASRLDLEIHAMGRELSAVPLQTMPLFPGVGHLYMKLARALGERRQRVVLLCDRLTPAALGPIDGFLRSCAARGSRCLEVLVISLAVPDDPARAKVHPGVPREPLGENRLRVHHVDLGAEEPFQRLWEGLRQDLLVRFLVQSRPSLAVGLDSWAFDRVVSRWGDTLRSAGVRTVRLFDGRFSEEEGFLEVLRTLDRADTGYQSFVCADADVAKRLAGELPLLSQAVFAPAAGEDHGEGLAGACLSRLLEDGAVPARGACDGTSSPPGCHAVSSGPPPPDVSCVVVTRFEGRRLIGTFKALAEACRELGRGGRSSEVVVVAARPGPKTRGACRLLERHLPGATFLETDGDKAAAMSAGMSASRGGYVAILEGADAISPSFLLDALRLVEVEGWDTIARPRFVVETGATSVAREQADMRDEEFDIGLLSGAELWAPVALARRELFLRFPWHADGSGGGWGHASWHWSCQTVHGGCRHVTVPRSAVFRPDFGNLERDVTLGARGWAALAPTRFLTDHPWLGRKGRRPVEAGVRMPSGWCDAAYLNAYPDVAAAVRSGAFPSGWEHFSQYGRAEGRVPPWHTPRDEGPAASSPTRASRLARGAVRSVRVGLSMAQERWRRSVGNGTGITEAARRADLSWLSDEMRRVGSAVPDLDGRTLDGMIRGIPTCSAAREAYRRSWEVIGRFRPTHVLVVPRVGPGGAELAARLAVDAILSRAENRVLLVATDTAKEGRSETLPDRAALLPYGTIAAGLAPDEQVDILTRLLVNGGARSLHVFYSYLGWELLRRHAAPLSRLARVFASIFSVPPLESGLDAGYARLLPHVRRHVTAVFTDNQRAADSLTRACGLEARQVVVLSHPVSRRRPFRDSVTGRNRILWAGRLDADKRPEILRGIAERLPGRMFDVWGAPVLDDGRLFAPLADLPNVRLCGPFAGFGSISDAPYHCFLYTSRWDGLPNVLLEAMASGLLAVGADVGAVREVLGGGCGVLVRPPGDPEAYVEALERSFEHVDRARDAARRGRDRVLERHTFGAFLTALEAVPGYL